MKMKIYFTGAVTAGRADAPRYKEIVAYLKRYGEVLTEHIGDARLTDQGEDLSASFVHDRDIMWLFSTDVLVAEVTTPSLGVGYEIGRAVERKKRVLCLYQPTARRLSPMIAGCSAVIVSPYRDSEEMKRVIDEFFKTG